MQVSHKSSCRKENAMYDTEKIIKNITNLLPRATLKQLRIIYLVSYEIIRKNKNNI